MNLALEKKICQIHFNMYYYSQDAMTRLELMIRDARNGNASSLSTLTKFNVGTKYALAYKKNAFVADSWNAQSRMNENYISSVSKSNTTLGVHVAKIIRQCTMSDLTLTSLKSTISSALNANSTSIGIISSLGTMIRPGLEYFLDTGVNNPTVGIFRLERRIRMIDAEMNKLLSYISALLSFPPTKNRTLCFRDRALRGVVDAHLNLLKLTMFRSKLRTSYH